MCRGGVGKYINLQKSNGKINSWLFNRTHKSQDTMEWHLESAERKKTKNCQTRILYPVKISITKWRWSKDVFRQTKAEGIHYQQTYSIKSTSNNNSNVLVFIIYVEVKYVDNSITKSGGELNEVKCYKGHCLICNRGILIYGSVWVTTQGVQWHWKKIYYLHFLREGMYMPCQATWVAAGFCQETEAGARGK